MFGPDLTLTVVQFSSVQFLDPLGRRLDGRGGWVVGGGDMTGDSTVILFQSFLQAALVSSSGMGRDVHSFTLSIQYSLCRPRHRPPSCIGALKGGFGGVVACDMPQPCELPSLDSCHRWFLLDHKEVDLAPHSVVGLVLQAEGAKIGEKADQVLNVKINHCDTLRNTFSSVSHVGSVDRWWAGKQMSEPRFQSTPDRPSLQELWSTTGNIL